MQAIVAEGVAREGLQEIVLPAEEAAAKRLADFVSDVAIDRMIADAQDAGISLLDGPGGLIGQLTARVIERELGAEMDDRLGYVKGDLAGNGTGNSRNGSYGKTVTTASGPLRVRDRGCLRRRRADPVAPVPGGLQHPGRRARRSGADPRREQGDRLIRHELGPGPVSALSEIVSKSA